MRATDASVRELIERAIELARRYAVWWQLSNKATVAQNEAVVNEYEDYFSTTAHALFESFVVITHQLYERRKDTISIPGLINELARSNQTLSNVLASMVDRNKSLFAKASAIRCGVYAHRSKRRPPEVIFATARLSAREMKNIVRTTTDIVASLADAIGVDTKEGIITEIKRRDVCAREDTLLIMKALRKHAL